MDISYAIDFINEYTKNILIDKILFIEQFLLCRTLEIV